MPIVEILDGPPEWAGVAYETDEDMVAAEIGMIHPRWRGTPVGIRWGALYAYRKVEVVGDRHRYRYQGPCGARPHRRHDGVEDLTGWDVLVVQKELHSDDRRKLWGSPVRVYAALPGTPRPDPVRPPQEQGWQELTAGGLLRRPRAPGTGAFLQERLARQMAEGNPWVADHWRRLAEKDGPAKDPRSSGSRTSSRGCLVWPARPGSCGGSNPTRCGPGPAPPFPARTTYIPMIGADLATIRGLGEREWMALQDRVLLVVHPERDPDDDGWLYGFARLHSAPPATPHPTRRPRPNSRAGRSWRRGIFSCRGCSTSRCTNSASARVVRHSACRNTGC